MLTPVDTHTWVHPISVAYVPRNSTPSLERAAEALLAWMQSAGCSVESQPTNATDLIITTARFGEPVERDEALFFHAKRQYRLNRRPTILTLVDVVEAEYRHWLKHFADLAHNAQTADQHYVGLGPQAVEVLLEQARRGGPEVALGRFIQAQVKSIRVMAIRTEAAGPRAAVHFDLAGAHPVTDATDLEDFAEDAGQRVLAAVCAHEVDNHQFIEELLPKATWDNLTTPNAMISAGATFTHFGFFTQPVYIEKLLGYRGVGEAISAQYSEGCYAVFDPDVPGLITTATGSSRLVDKRSITRADQAIVKGVKPEKDGALVQSVEEMEAVRPSVEAVEMMGICEAVPSHMRVNVRGETVRAPNVRAILHGHLGIEAYDPALVESVGLDAPYYAHLVSCGTGALALGTAEAFKRSESLKDLSDPRSVIFLEQPGHGVVIVEKWVEGKAPFDAIREALAAGHLKITMKVPQGWPHWETVIDADGRKRIQKLPQTAAEDRVLAH